MQNRVEIRGSSTLSRQEYLAIAEKMFRGCTELPKVPSPVDEITKKKREKAARVSKIKALQSERMTSPTRLCSEEDVLDERIRVLDLQESKRAPICFHVYR